MVLLNLQLLANFRTLKHWAMVISTAYYGWGAKETVSHVTMTKYIMDRVKSMKHEFMLASIPDEQENVQESEWVSYMQELRLDYYN